MKYHILTLFPEMIMQSTNYSIIKRALDTDKISINCVDIRDFSMNKHKHIDDYAYGGGAGMVMKAEPIYRAYNSIKCNEKTRVLYMSPQGVPFTQKLANELSKEKEIIILCGHYEGIDERIIQEIATDEISMGDFILTGGEIPALAIIDATARLIDGVLGKKESYLNESFQQGLLEYPCYTRPPIFNERKVPNVLLSGNHKEVEKWRKEQSLIRTYEKRPDILEKYELSASEYNILEKYKKTILE